MFHVSNFHPAVTMLLAWVFEYRDALMNASMLLGGPPAQRRAARLLADILSNGDVNRRLIAELSWLHRLLTLEHVSDPNRDEAVYFAAIDPADPVVYDLCILADGLGDRLEAIHDENARGKGLPKAA